MPELYAYTASAEFADAFRRCRRQRFEARQLVARAHAARHPDHPVVMARNPFGLDTHALGFADDVDKVPAGLSRAKTRTWLIPKHGKAGDPWRAVLARMDAVPSLDAVCQQFTIETSVLDVNRHRMHHIGLRDLSDGRLVATCGVELPTSPHLTPMPLSAYYAALEADRDAAVSGG